MKILELEYRGPPSLGGVETVVLDLSKQFKKKGHDVEIWSTDMLDFSGKKNNKRERVVEGIKVKKFRSITNYSKFYFFIHPSICPKMFFRILNYKDKNSVIHPHSFPSFHTFLALLFHKKFKKVIITPHFDANDLKYFVSSSTLRRLTFIILRYFVNKKENVYLTASTNLERDVYVKKLRFKESKVKVIPNGVNIEEFDTVTNEDMSRIKEKYRLENKFVMLFVGRVAQIKGIDTLIRAFSTISNENVILVVAGPDFGAVTELQNLVKELGIEEKVIFAGELERREVCMIIKCCDMLALPSRGGESFGIVLAEAMVCGKPVIGSRTGGIPEVIQEGENGLLFDVGNVQQLTDALRKLYLDRQLCDRMGKRGRELVKEKYTWEKVADKYLEIIEGE